MAQLSNGKRLSCRSGRLSRFPLGAMQIPAEFKCCVCLSVPEVPIKSDCTHHLCKPCALRGSLENCPVCSQKLGQETDEAFAAELAKKTLRCTACEQDIPLLDAESHGCGRLKKCPRVVEAFAEGPKGPQGPPVTNRSTFKCPWCPEANLSAQSLLEHCKTHKGPGCPVSAVCPICASMPWGDPNYVSREFLSHLELRHRCDYAVLTDFEADEEDMLRKALEASCQDAGVAVDYEDELQRALEESAREAGHLRMSFAPNDPESDESAESDDES